MASNDSLPSADGHSSRPSRDSILSQCRTARVLAHTYILEVAAMRDALTVQRVRCETQIRTFRLMLEAFNDTR